MPKAVWTGTLSFGLVTIPVRLYPATEPKDVRFHLMDPAGRRVHYRRFGGPPTGAGTEANELPAAPAETRGRQEEPERPEGAEEEVRYDELLRGVERDDGSVVLLDPEEIRSMQPERSRTIDIEDFVDLV